MANIGNMSVSIGASTAAFTAAMNSAVAQAGVMSNSIARAMDRASTTTAKALPTPKIPDVSVHIQIDINSMMRDVQSAAFQMQRELSDVQAKISPQVQPLQSATGTSAAGAGLAGLAAGGLGAAALMRRATGQAITPQQTAAMMPTAPAAIPLPQPPVAQYATAPVAQRAIEQKLKAKTAYPQAKPIPIPQAIPLPSAIPMNGASVSISAMLGGGPQPQAEAKAVEAKQRSWWARATATSWMDDAQEVVVNRAQAVGKGVQGMLKWMAEKGKAPVKARGDLINSILTTGTDAIGAVTKQRGKQFGDMLAGDPTQIKGIAAAMRFVGGKGVGLGLQGSGNAIQIAGRLAGRTIQGVSTVLQKVTDAGVGLVGGLLRPVVDIGRALFSWMTPLAAIGAGFAIFQRGAADITQTDIQARRLGVSILDVRTAMLVGGAAGQSMIEAIDELGSKSGLLVRGNLEVVNSFRNLAALSGQGFGMTLTQLGTMDTVEQFDAIAKRIQAINDPMSQATAAARIFGKAWVDILPALQGGGGLQAARDQARRFGLAVDPQDVQNVQAVNRAMRDLGAIWTGLQNQFTLGIAPIAAEIRKAFDLSSVNLSGFRHTVVNIAQGIGQAGAAIIDAWSNTKMIEDAWKVMFKVIGGEAMKMVGDVMIRIGQLLEKNGILDRFKGVGVILGGLGQQVDQAGRNMADEGRGDARKAWKEWQEGPAMQGVNAAFDRIRGAMNPPVAPPSNAVDVAAGGFKNVWQGLGFDKNPALIGLNKSIDKLWQALGAKDVGKGLAFNPALVQQLTDQFRQMQQGALTPLEQFGQKMRDLDVMQGAGMFAGDPGMLARLQTQAFQQASQGVTTDASGVKLAGAADKYSREAYSAVTRYQSGQIRNTVPEILKQIAEQEKAQRAEQIRIAGELLKALEKQPLPEVKKI